MEFKVEFSAARKGEMRGMALWRGAISGQYRTGRVEAGEDVGVGRG